MGDATNLVIILAGELLKRAEYLLVMGLHPSEVIKGYELAAAKAQTELESERCPPIPRLFIVDLRFLNPIIVCINGDSTFKVQPSLAPYTRHPGARIKARDRLKTVWIRRCAREARGRSYTGGNAPQSQIIQR